MSVTCLEGLQRILSDVAAEGRFALAYSGGLDSRFLAHAAHILGLHPLLLHVTGPHVPPEESDFARSWAERNGLEFRPVPVNPLTLPPVAKGARDRCYACKRRLFTALAEESDLPLCDGTNASDASTYRPGLRAVRELGVISPLALAGLTKNDIHFLAGQTGMEQPEQKPRPCLLTRLPYGTTPTEETLAAIAAAELAVRGTLVRASMPQVDFRLRLTAPDKPELHLLSSDTAVMPLSLLETLTEEAHHAMPGLPWPILSPQESLSGFFDRT